MIPIKPVAVASSQQSPLSDAADARQRDANQALDLSAIPAQVNERFLKTGTLSLSSLPPLALYIHFPWCVKKCPYCDFNSHEANAAFDELAYLDALRLDLEQALPLIWGRPIYSVFIGGGTPSLMSAAGVDRLMSDLRSRLPLDGAVEITMEANPGTFEAEKFRQYSESGVNRLSIGIQSFNSRHLQALGRIHDGDEAKRAIEIAQKYFSNLNLDLMFALPSQTLSELQQDLATALSFQTQHLSLYHLTMEPNTLFAKFPPVLPDDDTSAEMQDYLQQQMQAAAYEHYEVSAFAKSGKQSRHNLNYWQFGDYLGIGAGAHSKLSFPHHIVRQVRHKHPKTYMESVKSGAHMQSSDEIARQDLPFEFMLNALRLNQGFDASLFYERTGLLLNSIEAPLNAAEQRGLLGRDHVRVWPTELGRRFLNDLQAMFLLDD